MKTLKDKLAKMFISKTSAEIVSIIWKLFDIEHREILQKAIQRAKIEEEKEK